MAAGEYRHKLTIQQDTGQQRDSHGHRTEQWQAVGSLWAAVEPASGGESFQSLAIVAEATHLVRTRYRAGLTTQHRLIHRHHGADRTLHILDIRNVGERDRELLIQAKEVV